MTSAFGDARLSTGFKRWCLWTVAFIAALALTGLAMIGIYLPGDVALARVVQWIRFPGLDLLSEVVYRIGLSPIFQLSALTVAAFMLWRRQPLTASFVLLAAIARGSAGLLKELVERPRPSPFLIDVSEQANGFSFPSGHVLSTVLLWGFLYFLAGELIFNPRTRRWVQWSSLAIIALMGLQRVYTGAHWPTDVLAAYLWGGVILFVLVRAYKFCGRCQLQLPIARLRSFMNLGPKD